MWRAQYEPAELIASIRIRVSNKLSHYWSIWGFSGSWNTCRCLPWIYTVTEKDQLFQFSKTQAWTCRIRYKSIKLFVLIIKIARADILIMRERVREWWLTVTNTTYSKRLQCWLFCSHMYTGAWLGSVYVFISDVSHRNTHRPLEVWWCCCLI
jgi:hypothetical protein